MLLTTIVTVISNASLDLRLRQVYIVHNLLGGKNEKTFICPVDYRIVAI